MSLEHKTSHKTIEHFGSYLIPSALSTLKNEIETNELQKEIIFKTAIRATFMSMRSIKDIPQGGKKIEYPKGISFQVGELPESFDIQPRKIVESQKSIRFVLGKRVFDIEPLIGKIQNISMTQDALVIETTFKNITYNKINKLPDLCRKLRKTPQGKGEKKGFRGSTVTEL